MSLIAEYSFEEGEGSSVSDISGNGNNLTRGVNSAWVQGYNGSFAVRSTATNHYLQGVDGAAAYGSFPGGSPGDSPLTIMLWAKADTMPSNWVALTGAIGPYNNDMLEISMNSAGSVVAGWASDVAGPVPAATTLVTGLIELDQWVHVTGVFRPGISTTLYVNGQVATVYPWHAGSNSFNNWDAWQTLFVASARWGSGGAYVDDFRMFNEALSEADITVWMNTPAGEQPKINQLRLGSATPTRLYLGTTEVTRAYIGTTLVYGSGDGGGGVSNPANLPPTASFTTSRNNLTVYTDSSGSGDSDGTITNYEWDWGDTSTSTGANASHTYDTDGTYTISLTVTDDGGSTDTTSRNVTVSNDGFIANLINNPSSGGYPDATNTGVPAGVTLTNSGPITVTTNGAVIENLNIVNGHIIVQADNVTIRNCRITTYDYYPILNEGTNLVVEDCEITGTDPAVAAAISFDNYTARRLNISGGSDGLKANSDTLIEDCYIHDLRPSEGSHNDGIQTTGGDNVTVRHNTIDTNMVGVAIQFGSANAGWVVTDNLIRATGWSINANSGTTVSTFTNNRFAIPDSWYGPMGGIEAGNTVSGNYYDHNGDPI